MPLFSLFGWFEWFSRNNLSFRLFLPVVFREITLLIPRAVDHRLDTGVMKIGFRPVFSLSCCVDRGGFLFG